MHLTGRSGIQDMNDGQTLHNSPYVEQIERFAGSVKQLSQIFLGLEEKKQAFSDEEIEDDVSIVLKEKVCSKAVRNVNGAGEKILSIPIRWDMKSCLRWIITGMI